MITVSFPDTLLLTRPTAGTQNAETGAWTPGTPTTLYSGACDAQDMPQITERDEAGAATQVADLKIFLPWDAWITTARAGDVVQVTYADGATMTGTIKGARHLDRALMVAFQ